MNIDRDESDSLILHLQAVCEEISTAEVLLSAAVVIIKVLVLKMNQQFDHRACSHSILMGFSHSHIHKNAASTHTLTYTHTLSLWGSMINMLLMGHS